MRNIKPDTDLGVADASNRSRLDDWSCYEVQQAQKTERSPHIVGSICSTLDGHEVREGCVTSAIVSVFPEMRTILTGDGKTYELGRCSEMSPDAFYVWRRWQRAAQATNVAEVTADINGVLAPETGQTQNVPTHIAAIKQN